jgi:hypothetical protein
MEILWNSLLGMEIKKWIQKIIHILDFPYKKFSCIKILFHRSPLQLLIQETLYLGIDGFVNTINMEVMWNILTLAYERFLGMDWMAIYFPAWGPPTADQLSVPLFAVVKHPGCEAEYLCLVSDLRICWASLLDTQKMLPFIFSDLFFCSCFRNEHTSIARFKLSSTCVRGGFEPLYLDSSTACTRGVLD